MERTIVVTGAGSGIGHATALEAAGLGFGVVATVHHDDQVDRLERDARDAGAHLAVEVLDVTDDARAAQVIDRHQPWGLVNVSSVAGDANGPFLGWYEAAKQALGAVTDALRPEVARYAVDVVLVEPGPHHTPIWDKARAHLERRQAAALEPDLYDGAIGVVDDMSRRGGDPRAVATTIGAVLHAGRPRFRYRVGRGSNVLPLVSRVVPTSVRDRLTRPVAGL